jgi:hypothetical protein
MFIYLLEQKEHNRFKIGKCSGSSRILSLEKVWGSFDNDSIIFRVEDKTIKKEKAIHTLFGAYRLQLDEADGYTEFFSMDCYDKVYDMMTHLFGEDSMVPLYEIMIRKLKKKKFDIETLLGDTFESGNTEKNTNLAKKLDTYGIPLSAVESYNALPLKQRTRIVAEMMSYALLPKNDQIFLQNYREEQEERKMKQQEGIDKAKRKGVYKGRKPTLDSDTIQKMMDRVNSGEKKSKIAVEFGISRQTVYRYLNEDPNLYGGRITD